MAAFKIGSAKSGSSSPSSPKSVFAGENQLLLEVGSLEGSSWVPKFRDEGRGRCFTQSADSLALVVLYSMQCCHDATVSKHNRNKPVRT